MGRLEAQYSPAFVRDAKRLRKKHVDDTALAGVIDLIVRNTPEALERLRRRHRMHTLAGNWAGSNECHVANTGILVYSFIRDPQTAGHLTHGNPSTCEVIDAWRRVARSPLNSVLPPKNRGLSHRREA